MMVKKFFKYFQDQDYRFLVNSAHGFYDSMPDEEYLRRMFKARMGYELDLDNPKTFNEKLQWLKLHDRKPIYTTMVDKYEAKKYVASIIGEKYIVPILGVWDQFDDIDFDSLPNQFVLKTTHDSGGVVICREKSILDMNSAKQQIMNSLKHNFYYKFREWPYKNVKPRIIAEKYLEDEYGEVIRDYKVMCFNGTPRLIELHQGRNTAYQTQDFYDLNWNKTSISNAGLPNYQVSDTQVDRPETLGEMLELSTILSKNMYHIRVDWYQVRGKVYFGELTFFDGSGFDPFVNLEDDLLLGSWITLPRV